MTIAIIVASVAASVSAVLITYLLCKVSFDKTELICNTIIEGFRSINADVENRVRVGGKGKGE
jgi:hypothetical protein